MKNQKEAVLDYMQRFGSINVGQAAFDLGVLCLHKRIADLRKDGHVIDSTGRVEFKNRLGNPGSMAVHKLVVADPVVTA